MSKGKNHKNSKTSFKVALGFDNFTGEKTNFTVGITLFVLSIVMIICFISYFSTAEADQSLLEHPMSGDFVNKDRVFQNICGSWGAYTSYFFIARCFGYPAIMVPIFMMIVSFKMIGVYRLNLLKWFFCMMLVMIWSSVCFAAYINPMMLENVFNAGGAHGAFIAMMAENIIGMPGLTAILILFAIFFLVYLTSETIYLIRKIFNPLKLVTDKVNFTITNLGKDDGKTEGLNPEDGYNGVYDDPSSQTVNFNLETDQAEVVDDGYIDDSAKQPAEEEFQQPKSFEPVNNEPADSSDVGFEIETGTEEETSSSPITAHNPEDLSPYDPKAELSRYKYPTLDLLKKYEDDGKSFIDMDEQRQNKDRIVQVLRNFGVTVDSIKATVGPTITLYEITLAPGIKISKVRSLEDDIALSLAALGIRIIAPIPGRGTIGIEVPNANPRVVSMESILSSKKFQETTMALPLALGKTISNEIYMVDLAKIPHLLVAGATGQGKSVGLNAIITSLLYKKHPAELKFVLVDPKMVEFSIYKPLQNHFLAQIPPESDADEPIITDVKKVVKTLNSVCQEMDDRYNLLKLANVRKLEEYNEKFTNRQLNPEHGHRYLPYIVVIIDEYGDLIMTAGKEIELPIARIAQKARAVGIHMIIATQRPTVNIITGTIKANFPGRMAFKVMSSVDSKTILDGTGANQLIGRGDMLILDKGTPVRVQCAFVDTPEVIAINKFIADQPGYNGPLELPEPVNTEEGGGGGAEDIGNLDPLFGEAARVIINTQQGSTSLIQRKFSIGYNRAGRLMDQLEKAGVVGAAHGSKPRDVLIQDEETLQSLINTLGAN